MPTNPWKWTSLGLAGALTISLLGQLPVAEAAGPVRLTKALAALKAGKKFLEEAKDPPAPQHAQSMAAVSQAIAAVEREIKAYETASKTRSAASSVPVVKPPKKKDEKPKDSDKKPPVEED